MSFGRIEKPPKKRRMPDLLASPPKSRKWVEVIENRFEALKLRVVVDELLERGANYLQDS